MHLDLLYSFRPGDSNMEGNIRKVIARRQRGFHARLHEHTVVNSTSGSNIHAIAVGWNTTPTHGLALALSI